MTEARPKRRLWKRLRLAAGVVVVLLIGGRIALPYLLPSLLQSATPGVSWDWESSQLSFTGGSIELKRIVVAPAGVTAPAPIAKIEYLQLDIDMLALLGGDFVIQRVELDGADLEAVRDEEGHWNLAAFAGDGEPEEDEEVPEEEEPLDPNRPFDPTPGLRLLAGRLQHVRVHVEDRLQSPPVETWIDLSLRVSDFGEKDRDCRASLVVTGSHVDVLRLDADWDEGDRSLAGRAELSLAGLRTEGLEPWLEELGIRTDSETDLAAHLRARLEVAPDQDGNGRSSGSLAILDTRLNVDETVVFGVDELKVEASDLIGSGGLIDRATLTGLQVDFGSASDGAPSIGSISFVEPPRAPEEVESDDSAVDAAPADPESSSWRLGLVSIENCAIRYSDLSLPDAPSVEFQLDEASIDDLSAEAGTDLRFNATIPGSVDRISIGGSVIPRPGSPECGLDIALDGIRLESLAPWMDRLGCESRMQSGRFRSHVALAFREDDSGTVRARALVRDLSLTDGETSLVKLDRIAAEQVVLSEAQSILGVLDIDGLQLTAERGVDDRLFALGLAFGESPTTVSQTPTTPPPASAEPTRADAPGSDQAGGSFAIGRAQLKDTRIAFVDRSVEPAVEIGPSQFEFSLQDLEIGGRGTAGSWSLRVTQGALFDEFVASGRVVDNERALRADAEWTGVGLDLNRMRGYLEPAGLQPELASGSFRGQVSITAEGSRSERQTNIEITGVELTDRAAEEPERLFELPSARLEGLREDGIAKVSIRGLRLALDQDTSGALGVLGLRTSTEEPLATDAAETPPPEEEAPSEPSPTESSPFTIDRLEIGDFEFDLTRPTERGGALTARLEATAEELQGGMPRTATVLFSIPECLERIELNAQRGRGAGDLDASLTADGFGAKISTLLPEGIELADESIELGLRLTRRVGDGGESTLEVRDLALTGGEDELLLGAERITLVETPKEGAPTQLRAELTGLAGSIKQDEQAMQIAGFRFATPPASAVEAPSTSEEPPADPVPAPSTGSATTTAPIAIDLQSIQVALSDLRYLDTTAGNTRPIRLNGSLRTTGPIRIGRFRSDEALDDTAVTRKSGLELALEADPLLGQLSAKLDFDLQTSDPHAELRIEATGIDGRELGEVLPALADSLDASAIENGRIDAELIADLHAPLREDGLPDLSHGFGLDLLLRDLAVRPDPEGEPELALDRFEIAIDRLLPDGSARVDLVEASGLLARLRQEPEGLRIAGVKLLDAGSDLAEQPPESPTTPEAPQNDQGTAGSELPPVTEPVIGIERLLLQDVDLAWTDATSDEELTLPLEDVDIEVQGLRFPAGPAPVQFSAYLRAGDALLPMPAAQASAIGGLLSATRSFVGRNDQTVAKDPRPVFEEFSANGSLRLDGPAPRGKLRVDLGQFEMLALEPFARPSEIDIRAGELDTRATIDFRGQQGIAVDAQLVFRDLIVNDRGNKLSSALALSIPLESTLYLLRNQRGEQVIPLKFQLSDGGDVSGGQLTRTVTSALAGVIGDAVASSPVRLANVVTDPLGLTGGEGNTPLPPETVLFLGGSIDWEAESDLALGRALAFAEANREHRLVLQHELGAADLALAETLANPEPDQIRGIVSRIRQRRDELRVERSRKAVEVRSLYGSGRLAKAQTASRQVRALDREIGQAEAALDELLALLRPGAARRRARRTRDAAAALGRTRLERLRDEIVARGGPNVRDRIELRGARGEVAENLPGGGRIVIQLLRRPGR